MMMFSSLSSNEPNFCRDHLVGPTIDLTAFFDDGSLRPMTFVDGRLASNPNSLCMIDVIAGGVLRREGKRSS
jgi:hypothetical protein